MNQNIDVSSTYQPEEIREILKGLDTKQLSKDSPDNVAVVGGLYGWICPKCGAVMSPFVSFCSNCIKQNFEITCTADNSNIKSSFDVQQFIGGRKDKLGYE